MDNDNLTCEVCKKNDYSVSKDGKHCIKLKQSNIIENCELYYENDKS